MAFALRAGSQGPLGFCPQGWHQQGRGGLPVPLRLYCGPGMVLRSLMRFPEAVPLTSHGQGWGWRPQEGSL